MNGGATKAVGRSLYACSSYSFRVSCLWSKRGADVGASAAESDKGNPILEVIVTVDPVPLQKNLDPETGLALIDPSAK